jgi:hypothetical protein
MGIRTAVALGTVLVLAVPGVAAGAAFDGRPSIGKIRTQDHGQKMIVAVTVRHVALMKPVLDGATQHAVVDVDLDGVKADAAQAGTPVPAGCQARGGAIAPGVHVICAGDAGAAVTSAYPCAITGSDVGVLFYDCTLPAGGSFKLDVTLIGADDATATAVEDVPTGVAVHEVAVPWDYLPFGNGATAARARATRKVTGTVTVHEVALDRDGRIVAHAASKKRFAGRTAGSASP